MSAVGCVPKPLPLLPLARTALRVGPQLALYPRFVVVVLNGRVR